MIGAYAQLLAVALVPAAYKQEVSTVIDRPMQGCADLLTEPTEMPSMCSLEDEDPFCCKHP